MKSAQSKPLQTNSENLAKDYDAALLDLDGVVYVGEDSIPGVIAALNLAHENTGIALTCVTNNAARSSSAVAEHLTSLGLSVSADDVVTSAQAGAAQLAKLVKPGATVFVCGSRDLMHEVELVGLKPSQEFHLDYDAVINGYWPDMPWRMLGQAAGIISTGAIWVATNMDLTIPTKFGTSPGNGSMVNGLINATGRRPNVVAGKPETPIIQASIDRTKSKKPLMIGDRLDTDILGANNAGIDSLLVLSGVTSIYELLTAVPDQRPTFLGWDAACILESHMGVALSSDVAKLGGWKVDSKGLSGAGASLDAVRISAVASWEEICAVNVLIDDLLAAGLTVRNPNRTGA
jgi:HAD superfamily hydrolase (TIGR01450 family)